jgi:endoglucanase
VPAVGSYDAIRVYLWAGMTEPTDPNLLHTLAGYAGLLRQLGEPPAKVDVNKGEPLGGDRSPIGFAAAVLPFLHAYGDQTSMESMQRRLMWYRLRSRLFDRSNYYDEALILFGEGWLEKRYSFDQEGRLRPAWEATETGP